MKKYFYSVLAIVVVYALMPAMAFAQVTIQAKPWENYRPLDQSGVNVFEPQKEATTPIDGIEFKIGAGFTQQFQSLKHENAAGAPDLYPRLDMGFGIAQANLYTDFLLTEGVSLNLATYLSSRHHNEAWVKGGFIQFDKLPFNGEGWDRLMENVRIKVGHMEVNYGDAHFRRSDGGHTLYNPFIENYIVDAFATEVAAEIEYHAGPIMVMGGLSNGLINGGFQKPLVPGSTTETYKRSPSIYGKLAYDNHAASDALRLRLAGSVYYNGSPGRSTLFSGDRTGSNYFYVMEGATATAVANAFSGRVNPSFSQQVAAAQLNALVKSGGLEFFGTFETAKGRIQAEKSSNFDARGFNQLAGDLIYRFGPRENVYLGARYNTVNGKLIANNNDKQSVNRFAVGAGWFVTPQVLAKMEIVNQNYKDFPGTDIRSDGKFNGFVFEAVIGF